MSYPDQNVTLVYCATSHQMDCIIHVVDVRVEKLGMVLIANLTIARQIHVFPVLSVTTSRTVTSAGHVPQDLRETASSAPKRLKSQGRATRVPTTLVIPALPA